MSWFRYPLEIQRALYISYAKASTVENLGRVSFFPFPLSFCLALCVCSLPVNKKSLPLISVGKCHSTVLLILEWIVVSWWMDETKESNWYGIQLDSFVCSYYIQYSFILSEWFDLGRLISLFLSIILLPIHLFPPSSPIPSSIIHFITVYFSYLFGYSQFICILPVSHHLFPFHSIKSILWSVLSIVLSLSFSRPEGGWPCLEHGRNPSILHPINHLRLVNDSHYLWGKRSQFNPIP